MEIWNGSNRGNYKTNGLTKFFNVFYYFFMFVNKNFANFTNAEFSGYKFYIKTNV